MPFQSKAQQRFLFANNPRIAKDFARKTKGFKALPERKNAQLAAIKRNNGGRKG